MRARNSAALSPPTSVDVVIAGAGPAGLALAGELAARDVEVALIAAESPQGWRNNYAIWTDEARAVGIGDCLRAEWDGATVRIDADRHHALRRGYASIDNSRLAAHLLRRAGDVVLEDRVDHVEHLATGAQVTLASGRSLVGRAFVDATGVGGFLKRGRSRPVAAQVAFGQTLADTSWDGVSAGPMLMDFSATTNLQSPSFLYALPLADGRLFVEETSLVASPPMSVDVARDRLAERLATLGVRGEVVHEERCVIPMGTALPSTRSHTLGFGAAASMTHPMTGYQLAGALLAAPEVADTLAAGIRSGLSPAALARATWRAIWPPEKLAVRRLQLFGMDVVAALDGDSQRTFFDAFFRAVGPDWVELMSFTCKRSELARVMGATFMHLPAALRARASSVLMFRHPWLAADLAGAMVARRVNKPERLPEPTNETR